MESEGTKETIPARPRTTRSGNPAPTITDAQMLVNRLALAQFKADLQGVANCGDRCHTIDCPAYTSHYNGRFSERSGARELHVFN